MEEAMQISEENTKKRPRESPPPELPVYLRSLANDKKIEAARSVIDSKLAFCYATPLSYFAHRGMLADDSTELLRTNESFKKSWDCLEEFSISYDAIENGPLFTCHCKTETERESRRERCKRYLSKAAESNYFDAPPPDERPVELYEGFYVLYPDGPDKDDPVLKELPHFSKFVRLMLKLAPAAVSYHNFITGSDLELLKIKKANLFFRPWVQFYFITLEAQDNASGKIFQCKSRVVCTVGENGWCVRKFYDQDVRLVHTNVESFSCVECSQ